MNSLIDFKKFDKMNYHVGKDINKLIYHFSNDYSIEFFHELTTNFMKNLNLKMYADYRDKSGCTQVVNVLINDSEIKFSFNLFSNYDVSECIYENILLIYYYYDNYKYKPNSFPSVSIPYPGIDDENAYIIWKNLHKFFQEEYQFNKNDINNFHKSIHKFFHNKMGEIVDYRYN